MDIVTTMLPKIFNRPITVWTLVALQAFFGVLSIVSGALLIADPSGGGLLLPPSSDLGLPVGDYLLVGLFLIVVFGFGSLVITYGLVTRKRYESLRTIERGMGFHWSWLGGLIMVGIIAAWMVVEIYLIGFQWPVQYFTLGIGVLIFLLLVLPSVRYHYSLYGDY